MKKAKPVAKVKKIKKGRKIAKVKRIKKKPVLDPSKITVSKVEMAFGKFLEDLGLEVEDQFQIGYKFYDFKIKGLPIVVEMDGDYWHCNPDKYPEGPQDMHQRKAIKNDEYKDKLAAANGYTLIRVWESDFKEKPRSVAKRIKKIIKEHKDANGKDTL